MPSSFRRRSGTLPATAASQAAHEHGRDGATSGSSPAVNAPLDARRNASAAARYCSREKRSVTLTGTPAKIASSMAAGPPSSRDLDEKVPAAGACEQLLRAARGVLAASWARTGDTSSDTHPSIPAVRSGSAGTDPLARVRSWSASAKKSSSPRRPARAHRGSRHRTPCCS